MFEDSFACSFRVVHTHETTWQPAVRVTVLTIVCLDGKRRRWRAATSQPLPRRQRPRRKTLPRNSCASDGTNSSSRWRWRRRSRRYVPKRARASSPAVPAKVAVDLIGAVHVGEPQYYDQLNELFQEIRRRALRTGGAGRNACHPGQPRGNTNPVSFLQNVMKNVLKLEFQLDGIDYSRPNLVHADMSPRSSRRA